MTWARRRVADVAALQACARASGTSTLALLPRFLHLSLSERYSPTEIFMLGLLLGDSPVDPRRFVSKDRLLRLQRRANVRECFRYTEDKLCFYLRCRSHALPTPEVRAAWCADRREDGIPFANDAGELGVLLTPHSPWDLVMKPVDGVHGHGVRVLRFVQGAFEDHGGGRHSIADVMADAARTGFRNWLFQDRLLPHPDLARLSNSGFLQTARVVTVLDVDGTVTVPAAWLRIIGGQDVFDNFNFGTSGNLIGTLDLPSGRLDHVLAPGPPGRGLIEVSRHPQTRMPFAGFALPFAREVQLTVEAAARAFAPLRTIGWDVAITPTGPSLIEGNVTWDPLPTKRDLRPVADLLGGRTMQSTRSGAGAGHA